MLILFDVDGTLLLARGAGRRAMQEAGQRVFGPAFSLERVDLAGRIDPAILADGLRAAGVSANDGLAARFRTAYAEVLGEHLATGARAWTLPGVDALLERLRQQEEVTLGILSGNYPETGRLKLLAAGLDPDAFAVAAWGSDGATRSDLPPVAIARYADRTGRTPDPSRVIIIGDTPHDVACARAHGCRAVGVASGPVFSLEELRACEPDLLLADLTPTEAILAWIFRP